MRSMCGAEAGCLAIKYQSLCGKRAFGTPLGTGGGRAHNLGVEKRQVRYVRREVDVYEVGGYEPYRSAQKLGPVPAWRRVWV